MNPIDLFVGAPSAYTYYVMENTYWTGFRPWAPISHALHAMGWVS